jgi:hypothetical protein
VELPECLERARARWVSFQRLPRPSAAGLPSKIAACWRNKRVPFGSAAIRSIRRCEALFPRREYRAALRHMPLPDLYAAAPETLCAPRRLRRRI